MRVQETQEQMEARWAAARARLNYVQETREQQVARLEASGDLVKDCPGCQERYNSASMPADVFAPRHKASTRCQSGKRNHCTCDTCF
jgi:hypothetical protein